MALRKAGFSSADSPRDTFGSLTHAGSRPQRISANELLPSTSRTIGIGWVGATL
jgi:hypothetical protein